jgi:hypothetical protein
MGLSFTIAAGLRQRSRSQVRVPRNSWPYCTVSDSRLPQPGGSGSRIYIPQERGGPVTAPRTGFPFRCPLRLAGLRWRFPTPPSHGIPRSHAGVLFKKNLCTDRDENSFSHISVVARVSVAAGTCLPSCSLVAAVYCCLLRICCLAVDVVPLFVSQLLPRNKCFSEPFASNGSVSLAPQFLR